MARQAFLARNTYDFQPPKAQEVQSGKCRVNPPATPPSTPCDPRGTGPTSPGILDPVDPLDSGQPTDLLCGARKGEPVRQSHLEFIHRSEERRVGKECR